jgi:predicted nuclease with TOPRIM domain
LALEFAKSNFASMQTKLDKIMVKNEEYWTQLPTLQDKLSIIQVDLDRLQVERQDLEVEYWKVEMN